MATITKRVTSRGEVRWDARVRIGPKVHTKTHRTKELAANWARTIEDSVRSGEYVDPRLSRQTVGAYAEAWMAGRKLGPRTRETYEDLLARRILPTLGEIELRHLTPDLVRRWWVDQPDGSYSAKAYRLLRSICATAIEDGLMRRQPCRIEGAGKEAAPERPLVTPDELAALVAAAEPRARAPFLVAGWNGLRRGELLGLERRDFDLLHGTIRVQRSVQWLKGEGRSVLPPKSFAGHRLVHMPSTVADAVAGHLEVYVAAAPDSPFVMGVRGAPASPRVLHRWWSDARAAVGLEHVHFHDLRHAAGTMAAWTGATTAEVQAYLGHATPAAAMRYQHAAQSRQADMAAALDALARGEMQRATVIRAREGRAMGQDAPKAQEAG